MSNDITPFGAIRRTNPAGNEFWSSRDFAKVLGYADYRNFQAVVESARTACFNSGQRVEDHFVEVTEMVEIDSGAQRLLRIVMLSRYACYLVIQNADPSKEIVALGQTYFAIQTRRQELSDAEVEEQRQLAIRSELRTHNSQLADAAKDAGVIDPRDYAIFQNHGYMGLYGGLGAQDIHRRKGLKKGEQILDHMGSTELAANLFRATVRIRTSSEMAVTEVLPSAFSISQRWTSSEVRAFWAAAKRLSMTASVMAASSARGQSRLHRESPTTPVQVRRRSCVCDP